MLTNDRNTTRVTLEQMTGRDIVQADTVVIGAGPAGLATAARLLHASVPFVVLERAATAGASWRHRYHRLHLHTHSSYSALPYFPFPDHFPDFVSAQDLADYSEGVAAHMSEHIRYGAEVVDVELRQLKVPGGGGKTVLVFGGFDGNGFLGDLTQAVLE